VIDFLKPDTSCHQTCSLVLFSPFLLNDLPASTPSYIRKLLSPSAGKTDPLLSHHEVTSRLLFFSLFSRALFPFSPITAGRNCACEGYSEHPVKLVDLCQDGLARVFPSLFWSCFLPPPLPLTIEARTRIVRSSCPSGSISFLVNRCDPPFFDRPSAGASSLFFFGSIYLLPFPNRIDVALQVFFLLNRPRTANQDVGPFFSNRPFFPSSPHGDFLFTYPGGNQTAISS